MDADLMDVSSEELTNFKEKLLKLSKALFEFYEAITRGLNTLGHDWQDQKYEQFVGDFKASKEKIRTISEQYEQWANGHLTRKIEEAIDYEIS